MDDPARFNLCVFLGISIELLFAARGTEIIFLSFVLTGEFCRFLINGHFTDRINGHVGYLSYSLSLLLVYMF